MFPSVPPRLALKSTSLLLINSTLFYAPIAQAQLIPDNTLGTENSIVTPQQFRDLIEGGAIRGENLFHSFTEFNVNPGQNVYFANPQTILNIFTRVTGGNPSDIFGTLGVDGAANLILINPNGIHFGENASLDISGSFFTTTAESIIFNNGWEFSASNPQAPPLLTINITPGVQLGSNPQAEITSLADLGVGVQQNLTLHGTEITNTGNLTANGGTVQLLGDTINLLGNSQIDVSSPTGGGRVLIGGGLQGQGAIPTAARTYIDSGVKINADALSTGNGGTVVVWAEEVTGFYGNITARGGVISGDGGLVEVSGKQHLIFRGNVDTAAVNGLAGTLLLDPVNITIANGTGDETGDETGDGTDSFAGNNSATAGSILSAPLSSFEDNVPVTIYESELEGLAGDTNIILQATNDITLQDLADDELSLAAGSGVIALSADADGDGVGSFVMEDVTDTIKTSGRDIAISGASLTIGSIDTSTTLIISVGLITVDVDAGGAIPETGTSGSAIFTFTAPDIGEEISDLDVRFSAAHTFDQDLDVSLRSPAGTILELFNGVGSSDDNFQDTLLDDTAARSINEGSAPFDGSFRPTGAGGLAVFNGENSAGIWTLTVNDNAGGDSGELFSSGNAAPWGTAIGTQLLFNSAVTVTGGNGGAISLSAINGSISAVSLNASGLNGAGGAVTLDATGNISVSNAINTSGDFGDGGAITLNAGVDITATSLDASSIGESIANGGAITLNAGGGIITTEINSSASVDVSVSESVIDDVVVSARGGEISFNAGGDIATGNLNSSAFASAFASADAEIVEDVIATDAGKVGDFHLEVWGGNVNLTAQGNLSTNEINTSAFASADANTDAIADAFGFVFADVQIAGDVITTDVGNVGDFHLEVWGGNVNLTAQGNLSNTEINTFASAFAFGVANADANADAFGVAFGDAQIVGDVIATDAGKVGDFHLEVWGGDINLTSQGNLSTNEIDSSAFASAVSDANADADAFADVQIAGDVIATDVGNVGNLQIAAQGGDINITSQGNLSTTEIDSSAFAITVADANAFADAFADADAQILGDVIATDVGNVGNLQIAAQGGDINITSQGNLSTTEIDSSANVIAVADALAVAVADADANAQIAGDVIATDVGNVGNLQIAAQGGDINITSQGNLSTTEIDSSANADAVADADAQTTEDVIAGNLGQVGNLETSGEGGNIELITATGNFSLNNNSLLSNVISGDGDGGNIQISASSINLTNTQIDTTIVGQGNVGDITITALDEINLDNSRLDASLILGAGNVGQKNDIALSANSINLTNFSLINATTFGAGDASDVNLSATEAISLTDSSIFSLTAGAGNAGNINLNSGGIVSISGSSVISTAVALGSSGKGGDITLQAGEQVELVGTGTFLVDDSEIGISDLVLSEIENNLSSFEDEYLQQAQSIESFFSLDAPENENPNLEFSSQIPFVTILGTTAIFDEDVYTFEVERVGTQVTFDIDKAQTQGNFDLQLRLLDSQGEELANNNNAPITVGAGGSTNSQDPFLTYIFNQPGTYFIEVAVDTDTRNLPPSEDYTLYVSRLDDFFPNSGISVQTRGVEAGGNITIDTPQLILSNGTQISASTEGSGGAGSIFINTDSLSLDNSLISSAVEEDAQVSLGNDVSLININISNLNLTNSAEIIANTSGIGNAGSILIEETGLLSLDNSLISTGVEQGAIGKAGNITIGTQEDSGVINIENQSTISSSTAGIGDAGAVEITGRQQIILSNSSVSSAVAVTGIGEAGQVNLSGDEISLTDSQLTSTSSSNQGDDNNNAGSVNLTAQQSLSLDNSTASSAIEENGRGNAGSVTLNAPIITTANNSNISSSTAGIGDAGQVNLTGEDSISVSNTNVQSAVAVTGEGEAGNVTIQAPSISVTDDSQLSSSTAGDGNAGQVNLSGDEISLTDSQITSTSSSNQGDDNNNAGSVNLTAQQSLSLDNSTASSAIEENGRGNAGSVNLNAPIITTANNSNISSSTAGIGDAGEVAITGGQLINLSNTNVQSAVAVTGEGEAGNVTIQAPSILVTDDSQLSSSTAGDGNAGQVNLNGDDISLTDSQITSTSSSNQGDDNNNAGSVNLTAQQSLSLDNSTASSAIEENARGNAGSVTLNAPIISTANNSNLSSSTAGLGNAGNISVIAQNQFFLNQSSLSTAVSVTGIGNSGSVEVIAPITDLTNQASVSALSSGDGNAGSIKLSGEQLTIQENSEIVVSSTAQGNAGNLEVLVQTILLNDFGQLRAETVSGDGGSITLENLRTLSVTDNSLISASTAQGQGGTLTINATENLNLSNNSGLFSEATEGGIAGNLTVNTPQLIVNSNAQITVSSEDGQAGNLQITTDNLLLDQGRLTAETGTGEDGANINLEITDFLFLNNGSLISATARNDASGGNINLNSGFMIAFPPQDGLGSDISANAQFGSGGLVTIRTDGLFGIEFRAVNTPFNDITASSEFGAAGIVEILQPNVDPAASVTALSIDTVDASNLVVRSCEGTEEDLGRFVVTGRGGLPHSTSDPLIDEMALDGWITVSGNGKDGVISTTIPPQPQMASDEIVEATGWIVNQQGKVILTADSPQTILGQSHLNTYPCSGN